MVLQEGGHDGSHGGGLRTWGPPNIAQWWHSFVSIEYRRATNMASTGEPRVGAVGYGAPYISHASCPEAYCVRVVKSGHIECMLRE